MEPEQGNIRVRFAPSPTGMLHVGGARTALFNWLYARGQGGTFILRIEDTDRTRSTDEAIEVILAGMKWLGLDWDEGPYFQTKRLPLYQEYAEKLIAQGKAYYCTCSPEELETMRKAQALKGEAPKYDGRCREKGLSHPPANGAAVLRFKGTDEGSTTVRDLIRGNVPFENQLLDDFVLIKSDSFPTYNFAAVVDDHTMQISHVIRGEDHLSNTPRQILLYLTLGLKPPKYAHIPMILGSDRSRLSKRHGATSVLAYRDEGFLPDAMVNYLARLGWASGDQEIFTRQELIEKFSLKKVAKTGAIFDIEKLKWVNGHYIRNLSQPELISACLPLLTEAYQSSPRWEEMNQYGTAPQIITLFQDRIRTFNEIVPLTDYFFSVKVTIQPEAKAKHLDPPLAKEILVKLGEELTPLADFSKEKIEQTFKQLATHLGIKLGALIHPCRVALTGTDQSPPIYDVLVLLGKTTVIERLKAALQEVKG